jgi:hypothetical protein
MAPTPGKALHVELTRSILDSAIRVQDALHQAQVLTYLRLSGKEVGLLLNFWASPLKDGGIQRLIRTPGGSARRFAT